MPLAPELLAAHASIAANAGPQAALAFYGHLAHPLTPEAYWCGIWNETHEGFGVTRPGQELKAWTAAEKLSEIWWARLKRRPDDRLLKLRHRAWYNAAGKLWGKVSLLPTWRIGDRWTPEADA